MHVWTSSDSSEGMKEAMPFFRPFAIFSLVGTGFPFEPVRGATHTHVQHPTQRTHWILLRVFGKTRRREIWLRETMASAFFSIARSCRTISTSRR